MFRYLEIVEQIREEISTGVFLTKEKLPSLRKAANRFGCSIGTISVAYAQLEKEHLIYSVPQSGYYVLGRTVSTTSSDAVIDFYSGAPDSRYMRYLDYQHCVDEAISLYRDMLFTYSNPQGLPSLLSAFQKQLETYQVYSRPENIVITSGSQIVLDILCRMPFPHGRQTVLIEQPAYYGMIKLLELYNIPAIGIERGFDGINLDELERLFARGDIKFFYTVPRYHNPTGQSYSRQEQEEIIRLAAKYDVYIVEDDIAADFVLTAQSSPLHYYDIHQKVIYIKSFSKVFMPGLRIAAVVLPPEMVDTFLNYKEWADTSCSVLSQGSLAVYLESGMFPRHQHLIQRVYSQRMQFLKSVAQNYSGGRISWSIPNCGFFACLRIRGCLPMEINRPRFTENRIRIMDTSSFFLPTNRTNDYCRISISKANEDEIALGIPKVVEIFSQTE